MTHYFMNDENLKSEIRKINVNLNGIKYYYYTDNGVFSKERLDFGTNLLLETFKYDLSRKKDVLDIGCGCGPIGIYLSKLNFNVDMIDINKRALHLAKKALKEQMLNANVFVSDAYQNINRKYDFIITNPPIRVGKEKLYEIILSANNYLTDKGELWLVVRKKQGADSLFSDMSKIYNNILVVKKKKGYYIIKAFK